MDKKGNVTEQLKVLLEEYDFNVETLSKFLEISVAQIRTLAEGNVAFLKALISYHGLSKKTIAKMADVDERDLNKLLSDPPKKVPEEIKCRIAVTVMALRFFLKDCEQEPLSLL